MKIIAKNTTELCNVLYGDNEDYEYITRKDIHKIINNYINYLEEIRNNEDFPDDGSIGDIINLLCLFYNIEYEEQDEKSEESK